MTENNYFEEPQPDYEKAETDLLLEGLRRSYTERFHLMASLMKMTLMFEKAEVKHKPLPKK
ncbi:MAG: hypothetical protein H7Y13_01605 [Sphingobacteriaceae bacterium]|nr:hypothetical protein [Sphingobacteriaceae bacterium]